MRVERAVAKSADHLRSIFPQHIKSRILLYMEKQEYATSILGSNAPPVALQIWKDRLNKAKLLHTELAEWMKERALVEDAYAKSLQRMSKTGPLKELQTLGPFQAIWADMTEGNEKLAQLHSHLCNRLQAEVEKPLREYGSRENDIKELRSMEANLSSAAKEIDDAEKYYEKQRRKGGKVPATKVASASQTVTDKMAVWGAEAPLIFERLQIVDEVRITELKDSFVKYHTIMTEQRQASIPLFEHTLGQLLEVTPQAAILDFAEAQKSVQPEDRPMSRSYTSRTRQSVSSISTEESAASPVKASPAHSSGGGLRSKVGTLIGRSGRKEGRLSLFGRPSSAEKRSSIQHRPSTPSRSDKYLPELPESKDAPLGPAVDMAGSILPSRPVDSTNGLYSSHVDNEGYSNRSEQPTQIDSAMEGLRSIHEEADAANAAMSKVTNTLRAQPTVSYRNRGRRDIRSSMFPSPDELSQSSASATGSPTSSVYSPPVRIDSISSDSRSIRSTQSKLSAAELKHPELTGNGISASHIQTVNSSATQDAIDKLVVLGQFAFAFVGQPTSLNVRLSNFSTLEKIAVNPAYISNGEAPGEYMLNVEKLQGTQLGIKYQEHVDASSRQNIMPLSLRQVWKFEERQASLILFYKLNPASVLLKNSSVQLRDVSIATTIRGATVENCQSKPAGVFSKDRATLTWKLDSLEAGTEEGKLLARFTTSEQAQQSGPIHASYSIDEADLAPDDLRVMLLGSQDPFADGMPSLTPIKTVRKKIFLHLQH